LLIGRWFDSLVNRAVVLVLGAVLGTALILSVAASLLSRGELELQARDHVRTLAELVASGLDDKLGRRLVLLSHVARNLTMSETAFRGRARVLLQQQVALQHQFDGVYLIDAEGEVLAEYPDGFRQTGLNVRARPYFQAVSRGLTPVISEPYRSNYRDLPAVMVAAPVFNHQGRFIGMIGGAILLQGDNFLNEFSHVRVGGSGYLVVATRSGLVIANGRTREAMVPVPADHPVLADALSGFEGTRHGPGDGGPPSILSVQQMAQVPWFVVAVWPTREAFAPITRIADTFLWILLAVLAVLVPVTLWVFRSLMSPLQALERRVRAWRLGTHAEPLDVAGGQEIREVAQTFNRVIEEREDALAHLAEREAFFRSLSRSAPIGIVQTDVLGRIEFVNPTFEDILGRPQSDLERTYLMDSVHEADRDSALAGWREALRRQQVFRSRVRLNCPQRYGVVWADVMAAVIETPEKALGTIVVVQDITHELEVEEALRQEQQQADLILGVLQEGVLMVDVDGQVRYANEAACRYMATHEPCLAQNFFELVTIEAGGRRWGLADFLAAETVDSLYGCLRNQRSETFDIDLTMLHIRQGKYNQRMVFVLRDDSERRREEQRLSWEATHDSLTQLLNRRAFTAALLKTLGESVQHDRPSVLMLIDLDYFKPVNDRGGHLLGDDLLRRLAELFRDSVRQSDAVARLGGDEFGVILPGCGLDQAEALAEKIRARVEALYLEQDGVRYGVTTSIGLTEITRHDSGPREVMARADEGCYVAKSRGRNMVVVVPAPPG
jgi:diguanylate cyclase (GGDEF)-like protein/PAS domain S-box-containing protein